MKRWLAPILASCVVMAALPAMAEEDDGDEWGEAPMESSMPMNQQGMNAPGAKRPAPGMGPGWDALNLSDAQKSKIQALRDQFLQQSANERTQIRQAIDKVRALSRDSNASDADLAAAIKAKHDLLMQAELAHIQHWREIRKILTPEQLQQLDSRRGARHQRMMEGGPRR